MPLLWFFFHFERFFHSPFYFDFLLDVIQFFMVFHMCSYCSYLEFNFSLNNNSPFAYQRDYGTTTKSWQDCVNYGLKAHFMHWFAWVSFLISIIIIFGLSLYAFYAVFFFTQTITMLALSLSQLPPWELLS